MSRGSVVIAEIGAAARVARRGPMSRGSVVVAEIAPAARARVARRGLMSRGSRVVAAPLRRSLSNRGRPSTLRR